MSARVAHAPRGLRPAGEDAPRGLRPAGEDAPRGSRPASAIAAVHACRKQVPSLADEEAWRGFLTRHGGNRSLRAMDARQLGRVLEALQQAGASKRPGKGAAAGTLDSRPQARLARALWIELAKAGQVEDRSEKALNAFCERQTGRPTLAFCTPKQLAQVIEALKGWQERAAPPSDPVRAIAAAAVPRENETMAQARCRALWDALRHGGAMRTGSAAREDTWLARNFQVAAWEYLIDDQAAQAEARLGRWLRMHLARGSVAA